MQVLHIGKGVEIRTYLRAEREDDGQYVYRWRVCYRHRVDGELVDMTDEERDAFLFEHPGVTRLLLEHRAANAEFAAGHAERRLREAERRIAHLERELDGLRAVAA